MNKQMQEQHAFLIEEFNQYLFDHPEFLEQIPQGAVRERRIQPLEPQDCS